MKKQKTKSNKLNLGCDFDYKKGWINLDRYPGRADVVHDLDKYPWPFRDNSFDLIVASHVLEHLDDVVKAVKELHRISRPGAIIRITVPYFNNFNAFRDVTHKQFFTWDSFSPFTGKVSSREKNVGYLIKLFEYKNRRLIWGTSQKLMFKPFCAFMNWLVNINPEFMERRFPFFITVEALSVALKVKK